MRKRNNPFAGVVRKVTILRGFINWQYSSSVNRQRAREEKATDFKAKRRQWGSRIRHTPLVSHVSADKGETRLYLETKIEARTAHYFDRNTGQRIEGDDLTKLEEFFSKKERESSRQLLEKEVVLRDYWLRNIAELTMAGIRYSIAPAVTELQTYLPTQRPAAATARRRRNATRQPTKGAMV